jgi:hypothetical protein
MRCRACGASHRLERISQRMDDALEELLAAIPCDRL